MLRPYHGPHGVPLQRYQRHDDSQAQPSTNWKRSRRVMLIALPLLAFMGVVQNPNRYLSNGGGLRKLALQCVHNIYALNLQMAYDIPKPPSINVGTDIPSHIAICQEWIRRGADNYDQAIYIQEDDSVCMDWTAPSYRIMEIMASSILDRLNGRSRYRHDCFRSRTWDEAVTGVDRTTVQQMLPVARVAPNSALLTEADLKAQCKICLEQFDPVKENDRVKPYAAHHCLVYPETYASQNIVETTEAGIRGDKIVLETDAYPPNVIPLTSIYKQVRSRLGYVAKIMSNVTDAPPAESDSGVVIYIDVSSLGLDPTVYMSYFPTDVTVTSISILTSPLCASGYLPTGQLCADYAEQLQDAMRGAYPTLINTGFNGGHGIRWQMVASTAGMFSRMILAKKLICPPHTPNCLFPAMSKMKDGAAGIDTDAVVLESADYGKAATFFQVLGHGQSRVSVERLPPADIPGYVDVPVLLEEITSSTGEEVAPEFMSINAEPNDEGYLSGQEPDPPMDFATAAAMSDSQVMADIAPMNLPTNAENPNIYEPEMEVQPSESFVAAAVASNTPININYSQQNTTNRATDELGLDVDLAMDQVAYTTERFTEQLAAAEESEARIRYETRKAKALQLAEVENGEFPPSMEVEVFCPDFTPDGYQVVYDSGGYVKIDKGDELIISDGAGTVILDGTKSVTEEVMATPRDPNNGNQPYTHIYDPVTGKNVTITGTNITVNNANGVTQRDPVGVLLVDNVTNPSDYKATLITEGASGALTSADQQKKFVGSVIATGERRTETGTVIRHGRGYAIREDLEPGAKRTIYGPWNGFFESSSHSSSHSGGSGYDGTYAHHPRGGKSSSEDGGHGTSDSREQGYDVSGPYTYRKLQDSESSSEEWTYKSHADDHHQHRESQVKITIPPEDFKFGNPADLQRVCHKYKDRVQKASEARRAQEVEAQKLSQKDPVVSELKPERRQLQS